MHAQPSSPPPLHFIEQSLFSANPDAWRRLSPSIRRREYKRDEPVFSNGDAAHSLIFVCSGWVRLSRQTPDGQETVSGLCAPGDIFGEAALFPHASYPNDAQVIGDRAELAFIPASELQAVIRHDSAFSAGILALLNERVAQAQLRLEHASTLSSAQRLGCFLLRLCRTEAKNEAVLRIPVEKHVLASYLGMKPETLSRSFQQLKSTGIAVSGASVTVASIEKLQQYVCGSCSKSGHCDSEQLRE